MASSGSHRVVELDPEEALAYEAFLAARKAKQPTTSQSSPQKKEVESAPPTNVQETSKSPIVHPSQTLSSETAPLEQEKLTPLTTRTTPSSKGDESKEAFTTPESKHSSGERPKAKPPTISSALVIRKADPTEEQITQTIERHSILHHEDVMSESKAKLKRKRPEIEVPSSRPILLEEEDSGDEEEESPERERVRFSDQSSGESEEERPPTPPPVKKQKAAKAKAKPEPKGKGKMVIKVEKAPPAPRTRAARGKKKAEPFSERRTWLEPMIFDETVWLSYKAEFGVEQAYDRMELQGWFQLEPDTSYADIAMVRKFYKSLQAVPPLEPDTPSVMTQFLWDDRPRFLSVEDFASFIGMQTGVGLRLHQKKNWPPGASDVLLTVFEKHVNRKGPLFTKDLPLWKRVIHAFIVKNVMPRHENFDRVTICDTMIMAEVIKGNLVDTAQIMFYQMQCAIHSTTAPLPFPHLVKKIIQGLGLSYQSESEVAFNNHFLPRHIKLLDEYANIEYKEPLSALPPPSKASPAAASISSRPGLRSGDTSELLHSVQKLDESVRSLTSVLEGCFKELIQVIKDSRNPST